MLKAFVYDVSLQLGPFIPLIIVNCMIICRAEVCAIKSNPVRALCDAFGIGIGFTLALTILGFVRELLGFGTLLGHPVMWGQFRAVGRDGAATRRVYHTRRGDRCGQLGS